MIEKDEKLKKKSKMLTVKRKTFILFHLALHSPKTAAAAGVVVMMEKGSQITVVSPAETITR